MQNVRSINACERAVFSAPPVVVTLAAAVAKEVLPEQRFDTMPEIAIRWIQNATGARIWLSFGEGAVPTVDDTVYHNFVDDGAIFDCSQTRERVCAYSVLGGGVSCRTVYRGSASQSL